MQTDYPFPESLVALAAQLRLLRLGRKRLILLPHGILPPGLISGLHSLHTTVGLLLAADPAEFICVPEAIEENTLGLLLGYGIPHKPEHPDRALTLRDAHGQEILTVMADAATEPAVEAALLQMADSSHCIQRADPFEVLRARARWWLHFFDAITPDTITPDTVTT